MLVECSDRRVIVNECLVDPQAQEIHEFAVQIGEKVAKAEALGESVILRSTSL